MIDWLLGIGFIRKKLLFYIKNKYFHELEYSIPLESGYWAHLLEKDSYDSFSEIFIKQEYKDFIPIEPISRIIDIGAHYGYFSLWLQSKHPEIELYSLLVEPSPRCTRSLKNLINKRNLVRGSPTYREPLAYLMIKALHSTTVPIWQGQGLPLLNQKNRF